jgi:hypothetical protein
MLNPMSAEADTSKVRHQTEQAICRAYIERDDERFNKYLVELRENYPDPIPVSSWLPDDFSTVLAWVPNGWFKCKFRKGRGSTWFIRCDANDDPLIGVTHWLPMPRTPD